MKPKSGAFPTLQNVRVLDLTRNFAGPYCTMILGDLGADVIKVERLGVGDDTRNWAPPTWNGISTTFLSANRNKRSLAIDLNSTEGLRIVRGLALEADMLVESFRPGSLSRRGLGYEDLKEDNPGLIYCSISAYGPTGPLKDEPGYDPIVQAISGVIDMTGEPDQEPVRLPISAMDLGAGMWAVIGLLSAQLKKQETGQGCLIETSLFETAAWWMNYHIVGYLGTGISPTRQGTGTPFIAPYEVFPASDEGVLVCVGNDKLFRSFMEILGIPELAVDDCFTTNPSRVKNREELRKRITERFKTKTAIEWIELLNVNAIPCSRINKIADFVESKQLAALDLLAPFPHPQVPDLRLIDNVVSLDGVRSTQKLPPPLLGQHTNEILGELGYTDEDIAVLRDKGIVD
jgi:crotonobetainyl-CoA:carnitine CoA-transferase CaiB-like acyl-CoA transferase